jgi:DNA polymerase
MIYLRDQDGYLAFMETHLDYWDAHALLEWQVELGVSEAIGEAPVNRYEIPKEVPKPASVNIGANGKKQPPAPVKPVEADPADEAQKLVAGITTLDDLRAALAGFEHCDLRRGARNLVFQDGVLGARVMVVGDTPSREDDIEGKPFFGPAGALFDKMFAAIGLSRASEDVAKGLYITKALPWRPPENRDPTAREIAMLRPFLLRHIELANPDFIVLMGNPACAATLGRTGITRLRGNWQTVLGKPALPMMSPRDILRTPLAKRDAWADLLTLQARLREASPASN